MEEYKKAASSDPQGQLVAEMEKTAGDAAYQYVKAYGRDFNDIKVFGFYVDLSKKLQCEVWMLKIDNLHAY